jgi:GDP-L-fucose synthase
MLNSKIFLAGHNGLVGSSILRKLKALNFKKIITINRDMLNLTNQKDVLNFFIKNSPENVIIAAARVGGIKANNSLKAEFIYENLMIQNNLIHSSYLSNVKNLIFLGSSCVYPNNFKKKIKESDLLHSKLEPTNEPYAIAKIAGIKMCQSYNFQYGTNYKCLMPCNTFGPNDNYDLESSHFIPAIIKKGHIAIMQNKKILNLWGSGKPLREVIYVDELAKACIFFLKKKTKESLINIGSNYEMSIRDHAKFICKALDFKLNIKFNNENLNGTFRKKLDTSLSESYGWKTKFLLSKSIIETYKNFLLKS